MSKDSQQVRQHLIAALSQSSFLQFIGHASKDRETLQAMLETATVAVFKRGRVIIREGDRGNRMYFLAAGEVTVSRNGRAICTLGRLGDVFGEIGAITGAARSATVTALTDVTCLATDPIFAKRMRNSGGGEFLELMQQALTKILVSRLRSVSEELTEAKEQLSNSIKQIATLERANARLGREINQLKAQMGERFHAPPRQSGSKGSQGR